MKRSDFIKGIGLATVGYAAFPNRIVGQDDKPAAYQKEVVKKFVRASHNDLDKVKELLDEYPNLVSCQASNNGQSGVSFAGSLRCKKTYVAMAMLVFCALTSHKIYDRLTRHLRLDMTLVYSSWDWGKGDFETGIDAGGHVGHKEMVNFLINAGARPTLHALAMLGKTELVRPVLTAYPQLINNLGPHGFTFLHHAKKGGEEATELLAFFEEKGQTETKVSLW